MAQAVIKLIKSDGPSNSAQGRVGANVGGAADQSAAFRGSFMKMEGGIHDLLVFATIANRVIYDAVGELECEDGEPIEAPSARNVEEAILVSNHLLDMIRGLESSYLDELRGRSR